MPKRTRRAAKRLLDQAAPHIGRDVIIIAPGCNGEGYLASSMPTKTSHDLEALITMTNEALKKLRSWHRRRAKEERRNVDSGRVELIIAELAP